MVSSMNRLCGIAFLSLSGLCLQAQTFSTTTISTVPPGARFIVDGQVYQQAATFNWPSGSRHVLVFVTDPPLPGQTTANNIQTSQDGSTTYAFGGWSDNAGLIQPVADPVQTITANPAITTLKATLTVSYRILLNFFSSSDPTLPATCGAPGAIPSGQFRPGIIFINSQCYWSSAPVFVPANGKVTLNAFPYPGFVFVGWSTNNGATNPYLTTLTVNGPMSIAPQFTPGKRVHFITSPVGLNVSI